MRIRSKTSDTPSGPKKYPSWIAFLSSYPPRQCGIATFTSDLLSALRHVVDDPIEWKVVAMERSDDERHAYSPEVIAVLSQDNQSRYSALAHELNENPNVACVVVEHEYGLYGGTHGAWLIEMFEALTKPVVVTLHTVLLKPDEELRALTQNLLACAHTVVVMTHDTKTVLEHTYALPKERIVVVPHGIHPVQLKAPFTMAHDRPILLTTFGLLNPSKGIEYALEALPGLVKRFPLLHYRIVGVTHPVVRRREREHYRERLESLVNRLELSNNVFFDNRYVNLTELMDILRETDIYLSTSLDPHQAVSGTLSYAMGAGCAVVSTAFVHAKAIVTPDVGRLVGFHNPRAFQEAIEELITTPNLLANCSRNAYYRTRSITWDNIALKFARILEPLVLDDDKQLSLRIPAFNPQHILRLIDDFGMIQFSDFATPNPSSGYTLDDTARAAGVLTRAYERQRDTRLLPPIKICLSFIERVQQEDGYFANVVGTDRVIAKASNSDGRDDASARALEALALLMRSSALPLPIKGRARALFERSLAQGVRFSSPRAAAFFIKALVAVHDLLPQSLTHPMLTSHAEFLINLHATHRKGVWQWFEPILSYANAVLPEALLACASITGEGHYQRCALTTLDFLLSKTMRHGYYLPIGQKWWYRRGKTRSLYDQQPEDVAAMVETLAAACAATGDEQYRILQRTVFEWFLGNNSERLRVYDDATGGCYDGLNKEGLNLNEGAESTIVYLSARLMMEK